jgi:hypothetical protein
MLPLFRRKDTNMTNDTMVELLSPVGIDLDELLRVLNGSGYLVVGYPEVLWDSYDIEGRLTALAEDKQKNVGQFLASFSVKLCVEDLVEINGPDVAVSHNSKIINYPAIISPDDWNNNLPSIRYTFGVFRKH